MSGDFAGVQVRVWVGRKMDGSPWRRTEFGAFEEQGEEHTGQERTGQADAGGFQHCHCLV